jgi:hypothetical protein
MCLTNNKYLVNSQHLNYSLGGAPMTQLIPSTVHIRFHGRSEELTLAMLHLTSHATDAQIKQAIAHHFDLPAHSLHDHVVVRNSQAIIVRPEAIYG